jgi:hypothetical protein
MTSEYMTRVLADSRDRPKWLAARVGKVGGSDAGSYARVASVPLYVKQKRAEIFQGNAYTQHGNAREARMLRAFNLEQNTLLFHAEDNPRHVSTPDAVRRASSGDLILGEAKTTTKDFLKVPPNYFRQCQWNMHVLGADRLLFVWEVHKNFHAVYPEPSSMWVYRDDDVISTLITIADLVLAGIDQADQFRQELSQ